MLLLQAHLTVLDFVTEHELDVILPLDLEALVLALEVLDLALEDWSPLFLTLRRFCVTGTSAGFAGACSSPSGTVGKCEGSVSGV